MMSKMMKTKMVMKKKTTELYGLFSIFLAFEVIFFAMWILIFPTIGDLLVTGIDKTMQENCPWIVD